MVISTSYSAAPASLAGRYRAELAHDGRRYFLAYAVLAVEPFVLVPLLLGFMSAGMLGALGAVEALVVVLCGVTQLGVKFAYLQHVADEGEARRASGFWTATGLTVVAGAVAGCLLAPVLDLAPLAGILGLEPQLHPLTLGGLLMLTNLQMMLVTDLRARRNPLPFALSSALRLGVMLTLVAWWGPGASAPLDVVLVAQTLALGVSSAMLGAIVRIPGWPVFDRHLARRFLAYGWPIALGNLVKYGTDALLPWLCLVMVSPLAAGALALALKCSVIFDTAFGLPFLMAWGGRAYAMAAEADVRRFFPSLFRSIVGASLAAAALSWLAGSWVMHRAEAAPELLSLAWPLLPMAVAGRLLFMLHFPAALGFVMRRDMRWNLWVAWLKAAVFVCLGPVGFLWAGAAGGWGAFLAAEAGGLLYLYWQGDRLMAAGALPLMVPSAPRGG